MGALHADVFLLADARTSAQRFIDVFISVYILLILAYILTSWFRIGYGSPLARVQQFLRDTCEPYLRLFRRFIPPIGPLDVSPMIAILVLVVLREAIARVL